MEDFMSDRQTSLFRNVLYSMLEFPCPVEVEEGIETMEEKLKNVGRKVEMLNEWKRELMRSPDFRSFSSISTYFKWRSITRRRCESLRSKMEALRGSTTSKEIGSRLDKGVERVNNLIRSATDLERGRLNKQFVLLVKHQLRNALDNSERKFGDYCARRRAIAELGQTDPDNDHLQYRLNRITYQLTTLESVVKTIQMIMKVLPISENPSWPYLRCNDVSSKIAELLDETGRVNEEPPEVNEESELASYTPFDPSLRQAILDQFTVVVYDEEMSQADKDVCSICLEARKPGDSIILLPCGHKFHQACGREQFKHDTKCPVCRREYAETERLC